jgi:hypothetical protein
MELNEPNSHGIFYDYSKVFARVVSKQTKINFRKKQTKILIYLYDFVRKSAAKIQLF